MPEATSQKRQPRVQTSPISITVAVPPPQHSPTLGQLASSQTVCRFSSRRVRLTCSYRPPPGMRTFSQSGLGSRGRARGAQPPLDALPMWTKPAMSGPYITERTRKREPPHPQRDSGAMK